MSNLHRDGEKGLVPNRNSRILQKNSYWYYATREGVDIGPFDTRKGAELGAHEFIYSMCAPDPQSLEFLKYYRVA